MKRRTALVLRQGHKRRIRVRDSMDSKGWGTARAFWSPCADCGINTTPPYTQFGAWEWYMVWPFVWEEADMQGADESGGGFLCIGCLEDRLGSMLCAGDFTRVPINNHRNRRFTARLRDRLLNGSLGQ